MNTLPMLPMMLCANGLHNGDICTFSGTANLMAAGAGANAGLAKFDMDLYNGGAMRFFWSELPVVVDLSGMSHRNDSPVFRDHNPSLLVGHTERVWIEGSKLRVSGVISGGTTSANEVLQSSKNGFPWQASMGAEIETVEEVSKDASVTVNGTTFSGPLLVVRKSKLMEASFVPIGADDSTIARLISASRGSSISPKSALPNKDKGKNMNPELKEWLKAQGMSDADIKSFDIESPTGKMIKASYDASLTSSEPVPTPATPTSIVPDAIQAQRETAALEAERIGKISTVCAGNTSIQAKALREGWSSDRAELEVLRASRGNDAPQGNGGKMKPIHAKALEASALIAGGTDPMVIEKTYDEQTLEAAGRIANEYGGMNLSSLFLAAARQNGYTGHSTKVNREVLESAFGRLNASGFSTIDIGGILSNIANKSLLNGFNGVEQSWSSFAEIGTANDFKTMTRYRLTADAKFERVANGGEIKSGTLGEESYTNKVETFGRLFGISRQDFINDDLGALTAIPRKLGRGASLKLNDVFWASWLDDAAFFTTGNKNYITGAATVLSIAGLSAAITKFRRQTDANGDPMGLEPVYLVVPPELEATAREITNSTSVNSGGASTAAQIPNANIYGGRFQIIVSSYLTNTTAWYLAANPMDLASIEVAFLNNRRVPYVEQSDADFANLGVQMRGYFDFGVSKQDHRAAVKSKGAV